MIDGWEKKRLDELGAIGRGKSRHRPRNAQHLYGGDYPFIQTGDIQNSEFRILNYKNTYSEDGLAQSKLWKKNTLCISIVGANTAETAILGFDACFPDSVIGFNAFSDKSDNYFMKYYLDIMKLQMKKISEGAARENLSMEKLLSIKMAIPPLSIQKKIAGILSAYDDLIENNLKRIKLLEEMAQITYEEWFVRLRFLGHETTAINPDTGLPEGWGKKKIKDIGKVITGKTPSTFNKDFYDDDIPFIKTPDMSNAPYAINSGQSLSKLGADSQKNKYLPKNSLMVSCIGTVGVTGLVATPSQTNQQINSIVFKDSVYTYFMYCFSRRLKPLLEGLGSNGATMTNVNKGKFEGIEFDCPRDDLLLEFHDKVLPSFESILNLQYQNQCLREARDILLPRLMTGMIDVEQYNPAELDSRLRGNDNETEAA